MFSANIGDRHPRLTFFEDFDDLAFAVPAPFHAWLLFFPVMSTYRWYYFRGALPIAHENYKIKRERRLEFPYIVNLLLIL